MINSSSCAKLLPQFVLPSKHYDIHCNFFIIISSSDFFKHFYPGTMTTHAELINSNLQRGLDGRLRHTTLNREQNQ